MHITREPWLIATRLVEARARGVRWWRAARTDVRMREQRPRGLLGGAGMIWQLHALTAALIMVIGALHATAQARRGQAGANAELERLNAALKHALRGQASANTALEQARRGQNRANAELQRMNAVTVELRRTQAIQQAGWDAIAHDINNQLAAVHAVVDDVLLDMGDLGIPAEQCAGIERRVISAFRVIGNLVGDMNTVTLLDHARLALQVRPVDLAVIAQSVVEQLDAQAQQDGCRLVVTINGALPLIAADAWRVERALANLIGNALKYTSRARDQRVHVALSARAGGVAVVIADTGLGMDAAALAKVGQPFTRLASARGTIGMGIGVYLSRGIIEQHGGTLTYASDGPERGTVVTIWLPERVHSAGAA